MSILMTHSSFATINQDILSPLQQMKNGEVPYSVICANGLVLIEKLSQFTSVCVKPDTADKLVKRGWGKLISYAEFKPITNGTMISIIVMLKNPVTNEDILFIKNLGGKVTSKWTHINGYATTIPKDKLWLLELNPNVVHIGPDTYGRAAE
jgi:hypothetical protein